MGAAVKKRTKIRRVLKQNDRYICGLCRSSYEKAALAEDCVQSCIQKEKAETSNVEAEGRAFRCSYCKRVYPTVEQTKACVVQCKSNVDKKRLQERKLDFGASSSQMAKAEQLMAMADAMHSDVKQTNTHSMKYTKRGPSYICRFCKSVHNNVDDVEQCFDRHQKPKNQMSYRDRVAKARKRLADQKKAREQKDREYRLEKMREVELERKKIALAQQIAGEKHIYSFSKNTYKCRTCGQTYGSRREVVICYKAHLAKQQADEKMKAQLKAKEAPPVTSVVKADLPDFDDGQFDEPVVAQVGDAEPSTDSSDTKSSAKLGTKSSDIPDKMKFIRDGGKYVCRHCNERYFTKAETIRCFDSH